jgi:hypothetical protein
MALTESTLKGSFIACNSAPDFESLLLHEFGDEFGGFEFFKGEFVVGVEFEGDVPEVIVVLVIGVIDNRRRRWPFTLFFRVHGGRIVNGNVDGKGNFELSGSTIVAQREGQTGRDHGGDGQGVKDQGFKLRGPILPSLVPRRSTCELLAK